MNGENGSKTAPRDVAGARLRFAQGVELFLPADAALPTVGSAVGLEVVGLVKSDDVVTKRDRTMRYVVIEPTEIALIHGAADERPARSGSDA
jgi:hypothetical protein